MHVLDTECCAEQQGTESNNEKKPIPLLLAWLFEIRAKVYDYFVQKTPIQNGQNSTYWYCHNGNFFSSLLRTCGQIHDELAPLVYKRVRLSYANDDVEPACWLYRIGRNVSYIQHCDVQYKTHSYFPTPLSRLLADPQTEKFHDHFPFYHVLCTLYQGGYGLCTVRVSIERPCTDLPRNYIPPRRSQHDPVPWYEMRTEKDSDAARRLFFPEIAFTLRHLKWLNWVEKIIICDSQGGDRLFGPVLPYYLRGELGFKLHRISTRLAEFDGFKETGWVGKGPGVEQWELVKPC